MTIKQIEKIKHFNKIPILYNGSQYTLTVTNEAKKQIKKLISKDIDLIGLRINVKKSGCAGLSYVFEKVNKKNIDYSDLIFENNKIKLFIPYKIILIINESELDYVTDGLNSMFKFKNPNVHYLCGCGESFNVK